MLKKFLIFLFTFILLITFFFVAFKEKQKIIDKEKNKDKQSVYDIENNENNENNENKKEEKRKAFGVVINEDENGFTLLLNNKEEYQFSKIDGLDIENGQYIEVEYIGNLEQDKLNLVYNYLLYDDNVDTLIKWDENSNFFPYYEKALLKLNELTLDEKIGQLLLVRVPLENKLDVINNYHLGGYLLFARDFKSKTKNQVIDEINTFQSVSKIPLIIATDEEGGTVVRASSNKNLIDSPFLSPQQLYQKGGFSLIYDDTVLKSNFLDSLGVNVNLAPVADVSVNKNDYIFERTFGLDKEMTSKYIETVISASKNGKVSYTLKHFPGYSSNSDTHEGSSIDFRTYDEIMNDLLPFKVGIENGVDFVLVNHNIINSLDSDIPASLSRKIHLFLRNQLNFNGIIISDDMDMGAISKSGYDMAYEKAIEAGNDMIIVTDYEAAFSQIKKSVEEKLLSEQTIDKAVLKILAWKYYKELL